MKHWATWCGMCINECSTCAVQFDEFAHRVKTQLFVEGENRVNIIEHEKLLNAYTKLQAKCDKLKKEADEV